MNNRLIEKNEWRDLAGIMTELGMLIEGENGAVARRVC